MIMTSFEPHQLLNPLINQKIRKLERSVKSIPEGVDKQMKIDNLKKAISMYRTISKYEKVDRLNVDDWAKIKILVVDRIKEINDLIDEKKAMRLTQSRIADLETLEQKKRAYQDLNEYATQKLL